VKAVTLWSVEAMAGPVNFPTPEHVRVAAASHPAAEKVGRAVFAARGGIRPADVDILRVDRQGPVYVA
jgi:hypothetical protein